MAMVKNNSEQAWISKKFLNTSYMCSVKENGNMQLFIYSCDV